MKVLITAVVLAAAIGVFFVGRYFTAKSWNDYFNYYAYLHQAVDAQRMVRAVTYLREERQQDGLRVLETFLDGALLSYEPLVLRPQAEGPDESVLRAIRVARDYRAKHPWNNTDPDLSNAVQQVLALPK